MSPRRISRALQADHLLAWRRVASKLFVVVDVACFATQVAGAIMSGSSEREEATRGQTIIMIGLVVQLVCFVAFVAWTYSLHHRLVTDGNELVGKLKWKNSVYALYAMSSLFIIRNISRLIEYNQGHDGEMLSKEVYLYVLDAVVMSIIIALVLMLHPGRAGFSRKRLEREERRHLTGK